MSTQKAFNGLIGCLAQRRPFTIYRVNSADMLERYWIPTMQAIFDDPASFESPQQITQRLHANENLFLLWDNLRGRPAGIEHIQVMPKTGTMFIPCTGVLEPYRNQGIGSEMTHTISGYMQSSHRGTHTVLEVEDPQRLHHAPEASAQERKDAVSLAWRRLEYWRRQNCVVVDDTARPVGRKLAYLCPAVDDERDTLDAYHMAIRFDKPALKAEVMSRNGEISRAFVRACYLNSNLIQYGVHLTEKNLRDRFPAIDQYLTNIDAIRAETLPTHTSPLAPKARKAPEQSMPVVLPNKAGERLASRPLWQTPTLQAATLKRA